MTEWIFLNWEFQIKAASIIFASDGIGLVLAYYVQVGAKDVREMLLSSGILIGFSFAVIADIFKIIGPDLLIFAHPWDDMVVRFALIGGLVVTLWWEKHRRKYARGD